MHSSPPDWPDIGLGPLWPNLQPCARSNGNSLPELDMLVHPGQFSFGSATWPLELSRAGLRPERGAKNSPQSGFSTLIWRIRARRSEQRSIGRHQI